MITGLAHTGVCVPDCESRGGDGGDAGRIGLADRGLSHIGLICDDLEVTRKEVQDKGVRFTAEKGKPERPYFAPFG